jgi:SHS2 domain-containing protein
VGEGAEISVSATSCGFSIPEGRSGIEVKAVTYHGAEMDVGTRGACRARVLVDI